MRIALLDDSSFIIEAWKISADFEVEAYVRPEDFYDRYETDRAGLARLDGIITDFYFEPESELTGGDVLAWVKERQGPPVLLSTDAPRSTHADCGFAAVIEKQPLSRAALARALAGVSG